MRITALGHAGLFIETRHGSVLCDPWFNPAFLGSWFPFPANDHLDISRVAHPDYLYVSHLHQDHLDSAFLRDSVSKEATVILPAFPLPLLERRLRALGFQRFMPTRDHDTVHGNGLRFAVVVASSPADGPLGDSALVVDDGTHRILNQNDARPDADLLAALGPFDLHFLQFSGAIWYPLVYDWPADEVAALGRRKRIDSMDRAVRYGDAVGARWIIPSAGPACFLHDDLARFNDIDRDPANPFPDQLAFLDHLAALGRRNGRLALPGTTIELSAHRLDISHRPGTDPDRAFADKAAYLADYRSRWQSVIRQSIAPSAPDVRRDLVEELRAWFVPLLEKADALCARINGSVLLDVGNEQVHVDFARRTVDRGHGRPWDYRFQLDRAVIEHCIDRRVEDWVNEVFLSFRFRASRPGPYNEDVYTFFKCLSPERIDYAERFISQPGPSDERCRDEQSWEVDGHRVLRRCPHLQADLTRFGRVENGVLTCTLHGWQFELATGRRLSSLGDAPVPGLPRSVGGP